MCQRCMFLEVCSFCVISCIKWGQLYVKQHLANLLTQQMYLSVVTWMHVVEHVFCLLHKYTLLMHCFPLQFFMLLEVKSYNVFQCIVYSRFLVGSIRIVTLSALFYFAVNCRKESVDFEICSVLLKQGLFSHSDRYLATWYFLGI